MNTFALEVWDDEGACTTFYTVRKQKSEETEIDDFFTKYENDPNVRAEFDELITFIYEIGDTYGARSRFFRFENSAHALPPKGRDNQCLFLEFPLRLYCLRITDEIVILMNRGIKTSQNAQDSPQLKQQFEEANKFARGIDQAIKCKDLKISPCGKYLTCDEGLDRLELYF